MEEPLNDLTGSLLSLFKQLIADGVLAPGDRLPPERDLAGMLGVSRSSLRPALKVLESMGLITQRVGSGTQLNPAAASILQEPLQFLILLEGITFDELVEARLIVEPEMAARAAARASAEDQRALRQAIRQMEQHSGDPEQFVQADLEFHQAIYRAAGNRVCTILFSVVHQSLEDMIRFTSVLVEPEHTIRFHRRIAAAIRRHDVEAARSRMREHMEDASSLLTRSAHLPVRSSLDDRLKELSALLPGSGGRLRHRARAVEGD